jgi:hypothetical protein
MSIVAHQFNILSEQLRKGIGGLNEGKKQASQQALQMEQLKYGIEKDKRAEARADAAGERAERGMRIQEDQNLRAEKTFNLKKIQMELDRGNATREMKRKSDLKMHRSSDEDFQQYIRQNIDPEGTMNDDSFGRAFKGMMDTVNPQNALQVFDNPAAMMQLMTATDEKQRAKTIELYESQISEYNEAAKAGNMTDEDEQMYQQKQEALMTLKNAQVDKVGTAQKKLDVLNRMYAQITDPMAKSKAEFLIKQQSDRVDDLMAAENASASGKNKRIVKTYGANNPYTGKAEVYENVAGKGQAFLPPKGQTLDKPKSEMKVIDIGNAPELRAKRLKAEKAKAWMQKYGEMSELEINNMRSQGKMPEEIAAYSEFDNMEQMLSAINEELAEVQKAEVIAGMGLDNEAVFGFAKEMGITYEEAFEWLASNPSNIRE